MLIWNIDEYINSMAKILGEYRKASKQPVRKDWEVKWYLDSIPVVESEIARARKLKELGETHLVN